MTDNDSGVILRMEGVCKSFPGVRALDNAELAVRGGSVHALMGENGAGKSTLMKCLLGVNRMDNGRILLYGEEVRFRSGAEAMAHGVAMVHQELNQAMSMSVAENMWLGRMPRMSKFLPLIDERQMIDESRRLLSELGIDIDPRERMSRLSVAKRQLVEIVKAVSYGAKIIAFDEPTSSLNGEEAEILFGIIRRLQADGCGIIYISHKMAEIMRIADTITVMRDGRHIATRNKDEVDIDEVIRLMVGRELTSRYPKRNATFGDVLLRVDSLSAIGGKPREVSFSLRIGEILGIAGLDASGRTELLQTIFGLRRAIDGEIYLRGERIDCSSPIKAKRNGLALLTEERRDSGIFPGLGLVENATIASLKKHRGLVLLSGRRLEAATQKCMRSMSVKAPSTSTRIATLSGGNQQKMILGRWLLTEPLILMLDEPTRGIDVGAKYEIYLLINQLAESGKGVILVSSEMAELQGMCDRILVMSGGRLAGEVDGTASQERIMSLATKHL